MNDKGRSPSLAEIAVANLRRGGRSRARAIIEAAQACSFLWAWAKVMREVGHDPTRREYALYWKCTERTVYKDIDRFQAAFPTEHDPQNLARWLNARTEELVNEGAVMALPAPEGLVLA